MNKQTYTELAAHAMHDSDAPEPLTIDDSMYQKLERENAALRKRVKELEAALAWYADEVNYRDVWEGDQHYKNAAVEDDNGERAQQVLKGRTHE